MRSSVLGLGAPTHRLRVAIDEGFLLCPTTLPNADFFGSTESQLEAGERQHLKEAAILVYELIQLLEQQPTRPQRPASPSFTVSTPSMTATGDAKGRLEENSRNK